MPFLAPVFTGIGALVSGISAWAAASPILAGVVQTAFGIAAKYALSSIFKPKQQSAAVRLDTEYGADLYRSVGMGYYGTAGHHIYRNAYNKGNRAVQDVYVVSHFRIADINRVRFEGKWINVAGLSPDPLYPELGFRIPGVNAEVWLKIYRGSMSQVADPNLIAKSNPPGRWTANHRGAGMSYVIVTCALDRDRLTSPYQPFFEVKGAPLYDIRKDTSVGGSGTQRWNDQSTWVFSENTFVQMYCLERGIFNGTEKMVGKGVPASRLPISEWSLGANICDELVGSTPRYRSSLIAISGQNSTHDENMTPLLEASAASWVERVDGEFPIAGAPQSVVFTITDADLIPEKNARVSIKAPRAELINTVASQFPSPDSFYDMTPGATRIDAAALAADGERLASSIPYEAVIYSTQVDRLADIAIRGARYQANAEIVILPKYLDLAKPGKWITWNSTKYGNLTWQIASVTKGPLGADGARDIYLSLREISNGVFDPTAYVSDPPGPPVINVPNYLAEVQGFTATPNLVTGETTTTLPGVILQWTAPDDITVVQVFIEYRPVAAPTQVFKKFVNRDVTFVQIVEGLTSLTDWEVRTTIQTDPKRPVAPSAWTPFRTLSAKTADIYPIDVGDLNNDITEYLKWSDAARQDAYRRLDEISVYLNDIDIGTYNKTQTIRRELSVAIDGVTAGYTEAITVAVGPGSALALQITTLNANVIDNTTGIAANASAINQLVTKTDNTNGNVTVIAADVTTLKSQVNDPSTGLAANASAISSLSTTVTSQGGAITTNASNITALQSAVTDPSTGLAANASAISSLSTTVSTKSRVFRQGTAPSATAVGDLWFDTANGNKVFRATATGTGSWVATDDTRIAASATAITALQSSYDSVSASATFQMATTAAPSGWTSRISMQARVGAGTFRNAGLYMDVTATLSRIVMVADQIIISNTNNVGTATNTAPFFFSGSTLYLTNCNIENATIGNLIVGTSNIAPSAVSVAAANTLAGGSWSGGTRDVTLTINHGTGSPNVVIWGTTGNTAHPTGGGGGMTILVYAGATLLNSITMQVPQGATNSGTIVALDVPASGTSSTTYTLRMVVGYSATAATLMTIVGQALKR